MTTQAEKDALLARARKMQSVGASLLSNGSLLVKGLDALDVADPPAPVPAPVPPPFVLGQTMPDATTTGLPDGATLTPVSGDRITIDKPGTYRRMDYRGHVTVTAAGVAFEECAFTGPPTTAGYVGPALLVNESGQPMTASRCLFRPTLAKWWLVGFKGGDGTFTRCEFTELVDGAQLTRGVSAFDGCWVHDLAFFDNSGDQAGDKYHPGWTHNDGIQFRGVGTGRVQGCLFDLAASTKVGTPATLTAGGFADLMRPAGVTISPDLGPVTGVSIVENWIFGGEAGFQMSKVNPSGSQAVGEIARNRFDRRQHDFGGGSQYAIRYKAGLTFTGLDTNTYLDGAPVLPRVDA